MLNCFVKMLIDFIRAQPLGIKQFLKFCVVGGGGTITNLSFMYVFGTIMGINLYISVVICFSIAASQNYFFNEMWTFNVENTNRPNKKRYTKFFLYSAGTALLINLAIFRLIDGLLPVLGEYDGDFRGIFIQTLCIPFTMGFNFIISKKITFKS